MRACRFSDEAASIVAAASAIFNALAYVPMIALRVLAYQNSGNVLFT
jgi:hypothetical protein